MGRLEFAPRRVENLDRAIHCHCYDFLQRHLLLILQRTDVMAAIDLHGVTKWFPGDVLAVREIDLTVEFGEVFGFLGPNGAGKSTTINMLLDFVRPTYGEVYVLGHHAREASVEIRNRTGVLPEDFDVYDRLTGRKHIEFAIESKGTDENPDRVLERVGLENDDHRRAGGYSKGMRQRLALGMALVGEPDLLILDEPSTGLDPNGALEMREIVREEVDRGATVFFSSHILGQVEAVCDRVGILRNGQLVAQDSIADLRDTIGTGDSLHITVDSADDSALDRLRSLEGVSSVDRDDGAVEDGSTIVVSCTDDAKTAVLRTLEADGITVRDFETADTSLEELFQAYTLGDDSQTVPNGEVHR